MTHWRQRLASLTAAAGTRRLSRAERRQLRKLWGRRTGKEWRRLGNQRVDRARGVPLIHLDDLHREIIRSVEENGHILEKK